MVSNTKQQNGVNFFVRRAVDVTIICVCLSVSICVYLFNNPYWDGVYVMLLLLIGPLLQLFVIYYSKKNIVDQKLQSYYCKRSRYWLILLALILSVYSIPPPKWIELSFSIISLLATLVICFIVLSFYRKMTSDKPDNGNKSNDDKDVPIVPGNAFLNTMYFF